MKRIITTLLATSMLLMGTTAFAQMSVGAGYLNSTMKTTVGNQSSSLPSNGFYAGAEYLISEGTGYGISVGAYYSYITSKSSASTSIFGINIGASSKVEEMYIDVPVHFNYSIDLSPSMRGFIYAGPTFSCGVSSTTELSGSIGSVGGNTGKRDNYASGDYGRFDILVGGGAGLDFGKLRFTVGYDLGMLNRVSSDNYVQKRNVLHAGIGFLF
ncbi:MAG: outer membrane beta-barrel protein [Bacteroidales bacterium]|nr:outer membrane beta-barrel protein [Bacteroidales bacterium]